MLFTEASTYSKLGILTTFGCIFRVCINSVRRQGTDIQEVFAVMPLSALVADRILCMHGGLSPSLLTAPSLSILNEIRRPIFDPPNPSLPLDLLWADPDINIKQFKISIR
ncbi:unnamed protein product [Haemonchus placei]|uniref:Metallophos domain-containing protein n=1 Tax=Haemonchus placei TaxID=6290 RepID=A0A0N4VXT7_HAEPC|nr:unnamed protein product [Haemonchus placei]